MEKLLEAIQNRDLIEAKRAFSAVMAEKTKALIEQRRIDLARAIMIEAEEQKDDDDDHDMDDDHDDEGKEKKHDDEHDKDEDEGKEDK